MIKHGNLKFSGLGLIIFGIICMTIGIMMLLISDGIPIYFDITKGG